ncbi:MAG: helix-turn-helix domain-containing protein [Solirubrobacteraceae bacterium]
MDLPTRPDALALPTRRRLFAVLSDLRRPAGTEELAERVALHPNGVRLQLERLRDAGLVTRERVPQGPGRPRDMWAVASDARPWDEAPSGYTDLGRWLARLISARRTSRRSVQASGREIGRDLAPVGSTSPPEETFHATLASLGFQPRRDVDASGRLTYRLCNCPYREAARENQDVVCTLHRGITLGLLDELAPGTKLTGFVPRDPDTAGCLIELHDGMVDDAIDAAGPTAAPRRPA